MRSQHPPQHIPPPLPLSLLALFAAQLLSWLTAGSAYSETVSSADRAFFENRVRPLLVEHCLQCHSSKSEELGGKLRLDTAKAVLAGGESGPAVVPGKADESLLLQALRYEHLEMPPSGKLPPQQIAVFREWIRRGAPDPRVGDQAETPSDATELWSLQPLADPPAPQLQTPQWPRDSLDFFILRRLEQQGLAPQADASPRTLARRLYYDLIGLPPTMEQIAAFEAEHQRDPQRATQDLVDHLLALPQFGERWGRHWLDVVRYGESNGNDGLGRNPTFPHAWRYRDYVIDAWNRDLPYDEFITEQVAGDLLPSDSPHQRDRRLVATGMLAMASKPAKAMNNNFAMDVVADQLDVVGRGLLGLSIACARCHDHKFDPIPTRDYYALAGIFTSTETMWGVAGHERLTAPATDLHQLQAAPVVPPPEDFVETVLVLESNTGKPKAIPKSKWKPGAPLAMGVRDAKQIQPCRLNIKGDAKKLGPAVPRGFLSALGELRQPIPPGAPLPPLETPGTASLPAAEGRWHSITIPSGQSGRLQLARWLCSPENPLTPRVMVNRIWLHLFGEGLVRTPDDFGVYGERPTHPQLLDHLATRFIEQGWSLKRLIRCIVLSRTYQLASDPVAADPQDRWWARHPRRRLDAEALRDSMLMVSGQLDLQPASGSIIRHRDILVNLAGNLHEPSRHRSVYLCYLRSSPPPELAAFDLPDFTSVNGKRDVSTVPGQALHLFNSPFVLSQAQALAARATSLKASADGAETAAVKEQRLVDRLYQWALQRPPEPSETAAALALLQASKSQFDDPQRALAHVAQALLLTNEFRFVD